MPWYDPEDHSMPVISPPEQIRSKYPNMRIPVLPARAVVFCMGRGLTVLKELYSCEQIMEKLPGFITHSEVLGVKDVSGVCFLHGGYGAPQVACTIETLHVLGVKEVILAGLCGGFDEELSVGDILLPGKILSEEGTSLHYRETPGFAEVSPSIAFGRMEPFRRDKGYRVWHKDTVTTDAVYRQTILKEKAWRDMGCAAVDMEASALVNICNLYGIRNMVVLMVSDQHPLSEDDPEWKWGCTNFPELRERFIRDCIAFSAGI